ncbi:MAG TPA: diguanylate cyclase [Acidimicrobiales bacterium]|nr:diguanylate cyclase [Acidimicrobiales bacterium]
MNPPAFQPDDAEVVLVVDDDDSLRESVRAVLATVGIRSVGASCAREALRLQAIHRPAAALVDYRLPDGSGIQLARQLKELCPESPVLLLTGHVTLDSALAAVGQLDAYLTKPVPPDTLLQSVIHSLIRHRLVVENQQLVERLERLNAHQASYDSVTGLPNRALLNVCLAEAVASLSAANTSLALFFIDLDGFEVLNDVFGHQVGDELLRQMGNRLMELRREGDTVARFGGNELVVVCPDTDVASADSFGDLLVELLALPVEIKGIEHRLRPCVGIVVTDSGAPRQSPATLLQDADTAKYLARQRKHAGWEHFDIRMRKRVVNRYEIERGLRSGLDTDFALVYQPIIDLASDNLVGAEALLRWDRAGHGIQLPGAFLDVAEEAGLIVPIDKWVLGQALSDLVIWRAVEDLPPGFRLWVNVSPHLLN